MKPFWFLLLTALVIGLLTQHPADKPPQATSVQPPEPAISRYAYRAEPPTAVQLLTPRAPRLPQKKITLKLKNQPARQLYKRPAQSSSPPIETALDKALAENRATSEVARLHRLLDLTPWQKEDLFEVLQTRASPKHPAILLRTRRSEFRNPTRLPSTTPRIRERPTRDSEPDTEDEIAEILTPPQNQTLIAEERESDLWWTDILADIDRTP